MGLHYLCVTGGGLIGWFRTQTVRYLYGTVHFYLREGGWMQKSILFPTRWFHAKIQIHINICKYVTAAYNLRCRLWFSSRLKNKSVQTIHFRINASKAAASRGGGYRRWRSWVVSQGGSTAGTAWVRHYTNTSTAWVQSPNNTGTTLAISSKALAYSGSQQTNTTVTNSSTMLAAHQ